LTCASMPVPFQPSAAPAPCTAHSTPQGM
jgi:hypothetical protein